MLHFGNPFCYRTANTALECVMKVWKAWMKLWKTYKHLQWIWTDLCYWYSWPLHFKLFCIKVNLQKMFYSSKSACVQMRSSASLVEVFCHFGNSHQFRFAKEKAFPICSEASPQAHVYNNFLNNGVSLWVLPPALFMATRTVYSHGNLHHTYKHLRNSFQRNFLKMM